MATFEGKRAPPELPPRKSPCCGSVSHPIVIGGWLTRWKCGQCGALLKAKQMIIPRPQKD